MDWEIYKKIRQLVDDKNYAQALELTAATHVSTLGIRSFVACLEAACYERLGQADKSLDILLSATNEAPRENFWVYHAQAALFRNLGRTKESIEATRKAQACLGWQESQQNGYVFIHDFFSANIIDWKEWFQKIITLSPIEVLEIGSWQGGSSAWLLDKIIGPRGGRLTCVDTFEGSSEHAAWIGNIGNKIEDIFDHNISLCAARANCRKIVGRSQEVLRSLYKETFDFIYIDGAHEARFVIEDAVLSFGLLRNNGFILFDDYDFKFDNHPQRNTARAIDAFISIYEEEVSVLSKGRQCLIQKA
jgi:predicted O-methyltransferase YrrM